MRISVDGRRIRNNKVAFSNLYGIVWTGPKLETLQPDNHNFCNESGQVLSKHFSCSMFVVHKP